MGDVSVKTPGVSCLGPGESIHNKHRADRAAITTALAVIPNCVPPPKPLPLHLETLTSLTTGSVAVPC